MRGPNAVTDGYHKIEGKKLTMTGANGWPIVDQQGNRYQRKLTEDDNPQVTAGILTREIHNKLTASDKGALIFPDETFV